MVSISNSSIALFMACHQHVHDNVVQCVACVKESERTPEIKASPNH